MVQVTPLPLAMLMLSAEMVNLGSSPPRSKIGHLGALIEPDAHNCLCARPSELGLGEDKRAYAEEALHKAGRGRVVRIGMGCKAQFEANSRSYWQNCNAADSLSLR